AAERSTPSLRDALPISPLDAIFTGSDGRAIRLGSLFDGRRPVALIFAYDRCPMLCGLVLGGAATAFGKTDLAIGEDYRAVTISRSEEHTSELQSRETLA